ncbi:glia maturation factor beta isoform X2 [Prionailurus iriomotensis]
MNVRIAQAALSVRAGSESLVVCDVAEDLVEKLRKFRFRKETNNAAIIILTIHRKLKIDKDKRLVVLDEELEGISPDELKDELPERQPRNPVGCKPEQQMMYAGSKNKLVQTAELTKVFEIRNTEDLTEEWLREKLGFFH